MGNLDILFLWLLTRYTKKIVDFNIKYEHFTSTIFEEISNEMQNPINRILLVFE